MPKLLWLPPLVVVALFGLVSPAGAGDAEQGKVISSRCVACHGPAGRTDNPMFPNLAGQNGTYLYLQLEHFKSGERTNPLMTPVAKELSAKDIDDVATYFASVSPLGQVSEQQPAPAAASNSGG